MKEPSKSQLTAINHLSGPAQIIAGPGSGKTFTIIQRILHLIYHRGISPDNILVITYTKAAANEMQERYLKANTKENLPADTQLTLGHIYCGTFHSICYNILMQSGALSSKALLSENEKRNILGIILSNLGLTEKSSYENISQILHHISRSKNLPQDLLTTEPVLISDFSEAELFTIQNEYLHLLKEQKRLDFDDMILNCLELLKNNVSICHKYQNHFQYILADEFQDINLPQYEILKLLAKPNNNLFVVGDDDQAIYGFRGATPGIMQQFIEDYPFAKQIHLTENYRSGEHIVCFANQVISRNVERFSKDFVPIRKSGEIIISCFEDRKAEEETLCKELKKIGQEIQSEECYAQTAVILRTNMEAMQYMELLKSHNIPVKEKCYLDTDIFQSFIWEDIKAFLAYIYDGHKRSNFIYFMNKPNHFFTRLALPHETVSIEHLLSYYNQNGTMLSEVNRLFRQLDLAAKLTPYMAVNLFRKNIGYENYLLTKAQNNQQRKLWFHQLEELHSIIKKHVSYQSVKTMEKENGQIKSTANTHLFSAGVNVITMHGAKGLEFERVFLPDVNEGIIPNRKCTSMKELEEERRLLYVAITRAKDKLFIYYTKERNRKISPYLEGITLPHHPLTHQILHYPDIHQRHPQQVHIPRHPL